MFSLVPIGGECAWVGNRHMCATIDYIKPFYPVQCSLLILSFVGSRSFSASFFAKHMPCAQPIFSLNYHQVIFFSDKVIDLLGSLVSMKTIVNLS